MGDLDQKPKTDLEQEQQRRGEDDEQQEGAAEDASLLSWDGDVEGFMHRLDLLLRGLTASMGHLEFHSLAVEYRSLSMMGRRSVANRLQRMGLHNLLRALHADDYRLYCDGWAAEAKMARGEDDPNKTR